MSTQPYFYLQNVLGSTLYRVCTIPDRQRGSKMHLQISDELLSTESNFYLQNQFLSTQPYFYLQNVLGSTLYRVYTIPAGEIVPKTYLRSSRRIIIYRLQFLSTSCNYYLHPIIIIYTWRISLKFTKQGFLSCLVITVDDGAIFIHKF